MSYDKNYDLPNSTMAIVSLVASILGVTFAPLLGSLIGVITGHMAKREIRESMGRVGGDGLATAGQIIGYIGLGLWLVGICIAVLFVVLGVGTSLFFWSNSSLLGLLPV